MSDRSYVTPQTQDGVVSRVLAASPSQVDVEIRIPLSERFCALTRDRLSELTFAARSRIARLGIDVTPTTETVIDGDVAVLRAQVESAIPSYGVGRFLCDVFVPGLRIGRLVFCPEEDRLGPEEITEALRTGALQLPANFSVGADGQFTIRPHRRIYEPVRELTREDVISILAQADGRSVLNRLQVSKPVENIVMPPGTGVVTSCSMFLHRHYVVLDRESERLGRHLQATVLDPIRTRGTRVFLEFTNRSDTTIVNPSVSARVYKATPGRPPRRVFAVEMPQADGTQTVTFEAVRDLFDRLEANGVQAHYYKRLVAVVDDWKRAMAGEVPRRVWRGPKVPPTSIDDLRSSREYGASTPEFGTAILRDLAPEARTTVLLGYFPNLIEHIDLCQAARERKIERIVFRRASYEHGPFLSAKDQSRLADYRALGLEVFWCNDAMGHLAVHVYRGLRGYFLEPRNITRFQNALVIAIYGSARPLLEQDALKLRDLLGGLKRLFGENLTILTGGGPGAMQQATHIAHDLGILVGANYIETVDQETNKTADFYQCFQDISRHNRQRWFEISSFQIFCTGGLGTLEEVGLTLTDMKLGVIELSPIVFFGRHDGRPYWQDLFEQFGTMVHDERAPRWLTENVLLTDDPEAVPPFYKRVLELG